MGKYVTRAWPPGSSHEYAAYVPHPLAGWEPDLSRLALDRIAAAEADIAETVAAATANRSYQWAADSIMAQGESLSSSAIEGIYASLEGMSLADSGDGRDTANKAALGNWEMLEQALEFAESGELLTVGGLCGMHDTLMARTGSPQLGGKLRSGPIWIGEPALAGMGPIGAQFVPPPEEAVRPLLDDLLDYLNYSDHSPVLRAAVAHAQFETIHPFADGNGRTGRALFPIALFGSGGSAIHLPISRSILADRSGYYASLQQTHYEGPPHDRQRDAAIEPWIGMFSDCAQRAAAQVRAVAARVETMMGDWLERLGGARPDSAVWKIASELAYQPVFTADTLHTELDGSASIAAIRRGIDSLAKAGIVQEIGHSGRTRVWRAAEIIEVAESVLATNEITAAAAQTHQGFNLVEVKPAAASSTAARKRAGAGAGSRPAAVWQCAKKSSRSKRLCVRPANHEGRHRYR